MCRRSKLFGVEKSYNMPYQRNSEPVVTVSANLGAAELVELPGTGNEPS